MFKEKDANRGILAIWPLLERLKKTSAYVAGGYARYCLSPNQRTPLPSDIDVFVCNEEDFEPTFQNVLEIALRPKKVKVPIMGGEIKLELDTKESVNKDERIVFETKQSVGLRISETLPIVQIVKPREILNGKTFGPPNELVEAFDLSVTRAFLGPNMGFVGENFDNDEIHCLIRIEHIVCPIATTRRIMKYVQRGYRVPSWTEVFKLFADWDGRDAEQHDQIVRALGGEMTDEELLAFYDEMTVD